MSPDHEISRKLIAPCGLDCSRCVGCSAGNVAEHARIIADTLGANFHNYAGRLASFNPAMNSYPQFRELLDSLSNPSCDGCRSENRTCLPQCNVSDCVKERNIEFCFECEEFPGCGRTGLPEPLLARWEKNNRIMQKLGVDGYIELQARKPRYP
ncbi:DUF3795 domain-containing protein [Maridesulfovibrio sp. FT414]|uniref:DUF3795 domain-containing protein n=1 Tax=Maridesulfovibrio sp. FT414 TaxID=2979469 RepID=UPI003D805825